MEVVGAESKRVALLGERGMPLSREKLFETCAGVLLVLVSLYTAVRVTREIHGYSALVSSTTRVPESVAYGTLASCSAAQFGSSLALLWPRLATIRSGKTTTLAILCVAFVMQAVVAFASSTGRARTVCLFAASLLQLIREGSSRSTSQVGIDVEASLCDRFYGHMRDSATRYKSAAVVTLLMVIYGFYYLLHSQSIVFARSRLQKEIGVEQAVDLLGLYTFLFTIGSYQQAQRVLFTPLDLDDDDDAPVGRVARIKRALSGVAASAWEGRGPKKGFKHL